MYQGTQENRPLSNLSSIFYRATRPCINFTRAWECTEFMCFGILHVIFLMNRNVYSASLFTINVYEVCFNYCLSRDALLVIETVPRYFMVQTKFRKMIVYNSAKVGIKSIHHLYYNLVA